MRDRIERLTNRGARSVWGAGITYTPDGGAATALTPGGLALRGIFDSDHEMITEDEGMPISSRAPVLDIVLSDLAAPPAAGDKFTITTGPPPHVGQTFTVVDVQFDSAQAARLICVRGDYAA